MSPRHVVVVALCALVFAQPVDAASPSLTSLAQLTGAEACVADDTSSENGTPGCAYVPSIAGVGDVAVSPDGNFVYAAAQDSNAIVTFARSPDGALSFRGCTSDDATDGRYGTTGQCTDGDALQSAQDIEVTPDGRYVYAVASASSALDTFAPGPDGLLTQLACLRDFVKEGRCGDGTALEGASSVTISPDGHNLYVTASGGNADAVAVFSRADDGSLAQIGCVSANGSDGACAVGAGLRGPWATEVSPDGRFVYVPTEGRSGAPGSILTFARDPATGNLSQQVGCLLEEPPTGPCKDIAPVSVGDSFTLSPDGRNLYVAGSVHERSAVAVYERNQSTGELTLSSCVQPAAAPSDAAALAAPCRAVENLDPSDVVVSPDGKSVYVAEYGYGMIAVFARDPETGALSGNECIQVTNPSDWDGTPMVAGCQRAIGIASVDSLALSPDGSVLYATGGGVIAVFATAPAVASRSVVLRHGIASVRVSCPAAGGRACRGSVAVAHAHRATRFMLAPGATQGVRLRLTAKLARAVRHDGHARGRVIVRALDGRTRPLVHTVDLRLARTAR